MSPARPTPPNLRRKEKGVDMQAAQGKSGFKKMLASRWFKIALGAAISLLFLGLALRNIDYAKLIGTFGQILPGWLLVSAGFILAAFALVIVSFRLMRRVPKELLEVDETDK